MHIIDTPNSLQILLLLLYYVYCVSVYSIGIGPLKYYFGIQVYKIVSPRYIIIIILLRRATADLPRNRRGIMGAAWYFFVPQNVDEYAIGAIKVVQQLTWRYCVDNLHMKIISSYRCDQLRRKVLNVSFKSKYRFLKSVWRIILYIL